ncbi:MAG: hypothetical protein IPL49_16525 [Saprospirales bacterium]|nr:hypothetical protein [Saprospirales bacterium]MBK8492441.1 hypothetical protein [Saprospirales bacterium]
MKDLGWTAFFALLVGVIAIFYLGREKNDGAYLRDGYVDTEYSEENEPPSVSISEINEDNMDFYAKPSASARAKAKKSSAGTTAADTHSRTQQESREANEYKTAKATTTVYAPTASSASKREAARKLNEKAAAAEKRLQEEKKRKSPSYVAAEKKLKDALASEDFNAANKAAAEMEKELGAAVEFTATKPGDKLPENPLYKKRN